MIRPRPLRALILYDLLRLRGMARALAARPGDLLVVVGVLGAGLLLAAWKLAEAAGRFGEPAQAALAGAGLALTGGAAAWLALRRSLDGPSGWMLHGRARGGWTAWRGGLLGGFLALIAAAGMAAAGRPAGAAILLTAFVAVISTIGLLAAFTPPSAGMRRSTSFGARLRPERPICPREIGLRRLDDPVGLLFTRWSLLVGALCLVGALARIAVDNANPAAALVLAFLAAAGAGATVIVDPQLAALLARAPGPLWRLSLRAVWGVPVAGIVAGLVVALPSGAGWASVGAAAAGALAVALYAFTGLLNGIAHGRLGPLYTQVQAGLLALLLFMAGPPGLVVAVGGLVLLYRQAARRRWSAA